MAEQILRHPIDMHRPLILFGRTVAIGINSELQFPLIRIAFYNCTPCGSSDEKISGQRPISNRAEVQSTELRRYSLTMESRRESKLRN